MTVGAMFGRAARSHRGIAGIVLGLAGAALAISSAFVGPRAVARGDVVTGSPVPASAVARLQAIANRVAKFDGDARPDWITVVLTTHGKALESATPGDTEPSGNGVRVYLITMKGTFTDYGASVPSGASLPTGRYLSLVVTANSFEATDFGLSSRPPPIPPASLGPVLYLRG